MAGNTTTTLLSEWLTLIDQLLTKEKYRDALVPIRLVLRNRPRHLALYERLLHVAWQLQFWDEGMTWGARLLSADPGNSLAWRSLAMSMEQRGNRAVALSIWQRAFEVAPYDPHVRSGVVRTTLHGRESLGLTSTCLATLYLRNGQWQQANDAYADLLNAFTDEEPTEHFGLNYLHNLQVGYMASSWQLGERKSAYRLARRLVQKERYLLLPWYVLHELGDANDKALAYNPLQMMDPDGEYLRTQLGVDVGQRFVEIEVQPSEVELLSMMG